MYKTPPPIRINTFTGGMANDVREVEASKYAYTKNFDTFSFKHRLVPYRSYEAGNDTLSRKIFAFCFVNGSLFGLGTPAAGATFYKKTTFTDGTWTTTANNVTDVPNEQAIPDQNLVYYAKTGLIYGATGTNDLFGYDPTGSVAWATYTLPGGATFGATVASSIARLVLHSKDDILYIGGKNKVHYKNGTGAVTLALTLPSNYTIKAMCEYGNYLAIGCVNTDPLVVTSRVFLWDRNTSLTTLSENIDWGEGTLSILEELEGRLIGISMQARASSTNLLFNSIIQFKYYAGAQGAIEFNRITGQTSSTALSYLGGIGQKANNRIYFPAVMTMNEGVNSREGIWSIGKNLSGQYAITVEYQTSDGTIPNMIDGFFLMGSYIFIAYSNSGTLSGNISKTDDTAVYSNNSIYESLVFDGGDSSLKKKLVGVTVYTNALTGSGSVVLGYKIDGTINDGGATQFVNIFTNTDTTVNPLSHSAINIESTGTTLPEFNEIQFQIISTGGAAITGFSFKYEITGKRIYE